MAAWNKDNLNRYLLPSSQALWVMGGLGYK